MENWQRAGFGLYVHWPFCAAKCPYCDFNSHVTDFVDQRRWRTALLTELDHWADRVGPRVLSSIFFGGGTPSMMPVETVAAVIEAATRRWTPANSLEVTLEANPTSADAARFAGYVDAGVNRMSVGLQALNDQDLNLLGRLHTAKEGRRAFDMAASILDRVSFDLIYARQHQTVAAWTAELTEALSFAGEHLSLYQLTIEDGTAFGRRHARQKLPGLPNEDLAVDLWNATQDLTGRAGLPRYETSNHGRLGAESRHNSIYWNGGDWVGIGPGAHGRISDKMVRRAIATERMPGRWLELVETVGAGTVEDELLPQTEIAEEYLLMGLRQTGGIDVEHYGGTDGLLNRRNMISMIESGLLVLDGSMLRTTEQGALLLNTILAELLS